MTSILVFGDLHGSVPKVREPVDAVIAPGDFCSDNLRKYMFNAHIKIPWWTHLGSRRAKAEVDKSLHDGRKVLEQLNAIGLPVFIVPGNWDWTPSPAHPWKYLRHNHYARLTKGLSNLVDVYHRMALFENLAVVGHGITSGPEFPPRKQDQRQYPPSHLALHKLAHTAVVDILGHMCQRAKKQRRAVIFISHNVPYNTKVDIIRNPRSALNGRHYGSTIAREVVRRYAPTVCIGGHMHEHFGITTLYGKPVINAGYGSSSHVLLNFAKEKLVSAKFYRGGRHIVPVCHTTRWT